MRKLTLVAALLVGSSVAFAQFTGETQTGGFKGQSATNNSTTTVKEALTLRDDTKVTLEGSIVKHLGGENYLFRDATGEISIEIDHDDWRGVQVGPEDTVIIYGEVDHHRHRATDIDVDRIIKK
ncbi:NirD/YgiW/YdeI family stress tolerance protein [Ignatzschineria rhizosphaerae]|uniref:NirD/YgiW/YdeI family stress tolerance protein n=1 Tax=Ignatzschineria rhizosphaerae TaxID=2923279 RepID=A0ABY3WYA7_9GAMM|nr:NirD/YgiW/YdeI family stress tolerance protein [Ignatzschineria rhizosphaerae]UNM95591.1 NirD/YgiW/YdeI family stress tolerance protein [Ignatzschineria rhizosphaerae]